MYVRKVKFTSSLDRRAFKIRKERGVQIPKIPNENIRKITNL